MKTHIASSLLTATLMAGLLARSLDYAPYLEPILYGACLLTGLLIGMGQLETAWRRYHDHQRRTLRQLSARTREELYLSSFFRGCPFAGLFAEEYHLLTESPRERARATAP